MQGNDYIAAAEPDWLKQADGQLSELMGTALEIDCPTLMEALGVVADAIAALKKQRGLDRVDP